MYNYLYLIDPNIASLLQKEHKKESIIVFDEAHNIDDVCIEAYTVRYAVPYMLLTQQTHPTGGCQQFDYSGQ